MWKEGVNSKSDNLSSVVQDAGAKIWHHTEIVVALHCTKISLPSYAGKIKRNLRERIIFIQIADRLLSINVCILLSWKTGEKK